MLWDYFGGDGTGKLVRVKRTMKEADYRLRLDENLKCSTRSLFGRRMFYFQHHNDPKHTSILVTNWIKDN